MSHVALTVKYRPQTFMEVAGQDTVKSILSRASMEDRVAAAYLFSGTRGVGKTTLARVFAKALNCRQAPTAEPCNACDQCRAITQGNAVDVVEIDGASNRGIDDVRRLKEVVGYAPMEGNYKIFIIDEAHMLSREAFNALLKTLEEPPQRVTFIMATTEAHKFPATIISRCQHFVLTRLPDSGLIAHLARVLGMEHVAYEDAGLRLIAQRGAGSVRDSMSLLAQTLALGGDSLTEASVRAVLGLAGHETLFALLAAIRQGDTITLCTLLRGVLEQGLDIGFFLRELVSLWRNLFILKQNGEAGFAVVELPHDESRALQSEAEHYSLPHIHACWQMTLEGQRRVLTSLEPAAALELLLLNLAMLPQLLSLEAISAFSRKLPPPGGMSSGGSEGGRQNGADPGAASQGTRAGSGPAGATPQAGGQPQDGVPSVSFADGQRIDKEHIQEGPAFDPADGSAEQKMIARQEEEAPDGNCQERESRGSLPQPLHELAGEGQGAQPGQPEERLQEQSGPDLRVAAGKKQEVFPEAVHAPGVDAPPYDAVPDWAEVIAQAEKDNAPPWFFSLARDVVASWKEGVLHLVPQNAFTWQRLQESSVRTIIDNALASCYSAAIPIRIAEPVETVTDRNLLRQKIYDDPLVQQVEQVLGAKILDYGMLR